MLELEIGTLLRLRRNSGKENKAGHLLILVEVKGEKVKLHNIMTGQDTWAKEVSWNPLLGEWFELVEGQ